MSVFESFRCGAGDLYRAPYRGQFKRFPLVLPGCSVVKFLAVVPIGRGNPAPTETVATEHLLSSGSKAAGQGDFYRRIYYRTRYPLA